MIKINIYNKKDQRNVKESQKIYINAPILSQVKTNGQRNNRNINTVKEH